MSRPFRIALIIAVTPVALVLLATVVFAMDRITNGGEILGDVSVVDLELGGLTEEDALDAVATLEERLATLPVTITVDDFEFTLDPAAVAFDIDGEFIVDQAFSVGRQGGLYSEFRWWLGHFRDQVVLLAPASIDTRAFDIILSTWEAEIIGDPPFHGAVHVAGRLARPEYPRPGTGIDRAAAPALLLEGLLDPTRSPIVVPSATLRPGMSKADIDEVVDRARALLAGPVTLTDPRSGVDVVFPEQVLAEALQARLIFLDAQPLEFALSFDTHQLRDHVSPMERELEFEPVDAEIVINTGDTVSIIPSRNATKLHVGALGTAVLQASGSVTRSGKLPFIEGEEPDFTTEDAEALGIKYKVSEFTTYHKCCQSRVTNIHLMADAVDGAIVMPGEVFSLNGHVGQRTTAKGYVRAGAIINNVVECCDNPANIGGGTSQFGTTFYNAVFFGGYEDIEHTPHSLYISRYPEGREATMGWPKPDVIFLNDSDAAILIKTEYTATSITVKFFGDNGGRKVEARLSGRFNYRGASTRFEADPSVPPGEQRVLSRGKSGWAVTSTRIITYPDGTINTDQYTHQYQASPRRIAVNPCELSPDGCPPPEPLPPEPPPDGG
ncbi:MAG: VanW family protein [Acidimicrobiia bacterium]